MVDTGCSIIFIHCTQRSDFSLGTVNEIMTNDQMVIRS